MDLSRSRGFGRWSWAPGGGDRALALVRSGPADAALGRDHPGCMLRSVVSAQAGRMLPGRCISDLRHRIGAGAPGVRQRFRPGYPRNRVPGGTAGACGQAGIGGSFSCLRPMGVGRRFDPEDGGRAPRPAQGDGRAWPQCWGAVCNDPVDRCRPGCENARDADPPCEGDHGTPPIQRACPGRRRISSGPAAANRGAGDGRARPRTANRS